MAYQDTLFQLGMDLTRSSTAQKEDHSVEASVVEYQASSLEANSNDSTGQGGYHLIIDLHGARVLDAKASERAFASALKSLDKPVKSMHIAKLANGTLSGVAVLSAGHWSIHAVPATGFVAVDVRGCLGLDPHAAMFALAEAFSAREAVIQKTRATDVAFLPASRVPAVKAAVKPRAPSRTKQARAA